MKERPILFSGAMVCALLDGSKTQTRRVLKEAVGPSLSVDCDERGIAELSWLYGDGPGHEVHERIERVPCPYGQPGDRLYVREAFYHEQAEYLPEASSSVPVVPAITTYRADMSADTLAFEKRVGVPRDMRWTPSIHMPRELSRITLEVTGARVERLQEISDADAIAEGIETDEYFARQEYFDCVAPAGSHGRPRPITEYQSLWDSLNAARGYGWDTNPWVWVVEFKRVGG